MLNVVSFKPPKFKPMPSELTPAVISGATLPVKIGIAQRAIAACCDLSELLTWKDQLAALAAAAKMARMPEMARDVNRVHKEAIFRMGEILLTYKSSVKKPKEMRAGTLKSERRIAAEVAGIDYVTAIRAARAATAKPELRAAILQNDNISASADRMSRCVPPRTNTGGNRAYSDAGKIFFNGRTMASTYARNDNRGFAPAAAILRGIALDVITQLTPEEKQRARKLVIEMQEILDDIDRRLGSAS